MLSSLVYQHSLRESAAFIEGIEHSSVSKTFLTADSKAIRLWSATRQIRASHIDADFKLIKLEYLDYFDVYLVVYFKPSAKRGFVELWNSLLDRVQKCVIPIKCTVDMHCVVSPSKSFLVITDENSDIAVLTIEASQAEKPPQGPWFPKASDFVDMTRPGTSRTKGCTTSRDPAEYKQTIKLIRSQIIRACDVDLESVQAMQIFNDHFFAVACGTSLLVFKRSKPPVFKVTRAEVSIDFTLSLSVPPSTNEVQESFEATPQTTETYDDGSLFNLAFNYSSMLSPSAAVVSIELIGDNQPMLLVGYDDGNISVFEPGERFRAVDSKEADNSEDLSDVPSLVLLFQAHYPKNEKSPYAPMQVVACPWKTIPGSVYVLEFFSLGSDYKLVHWGLRCKINGPTDSSVSNSGTVDFNKSAFDIDILGSYQFSVDSKEEERLELAAKQYKRRKIKQAIVPFEISANVPNERFSRHSSRRALMCSMGGMLAVFMLQQPGKLLLSYQSAQKNILSYCVGQFSTPTTVYNSSANSESESIPDLGSDSTEAYSCTKKTTLEDTVLLLCDGIINAYSLKSGMSRFQMSVHRVPVDLNEDNINNGKSSDPMAVTRPLKESTGYRSLKGVVVPLKQGDPCCVHFSKYSQHVIVGYSDGNVSLFTMDVPHAPHSPSKPMKSVIPSHCYRLNTQSVHSSPVTVLTSIPKEHEVRDATQDSISNQHSWIVVADNDGIMSSWKIFHKDSSRSKSGAKLSSSVQAHKNGIVQIETVNIIHAVANASVPPLDVKVGYSLLITACVAGEIKVWSICGITGELAWVGGLDSRVKLSSISAISLQSVSHQNNDSNMKSNCDTNGDRNDKNEEESDQQAEEFNVMCTSGHSNGRLIAWIFSSNIKNTRDSPTSVIDAHSGPVIAIHALSNVPQFNSFADTGSSHNIVRYMISASCDGSCCLFGVTKSACIVPLHQYFAPGPTKGISVSYNNSSSNSYATEVEIFQVNQSNVTSFIACAPSALSSAIPYRWRESSAPIDMALVHTIAKPTRPSSGSSVDSANSLKSIVVGSAEYPIQQVRKASSSSMPNVLLEWDAEANTVSPSPYIVDARKHDSMVSPLNTPTSQDSFSLASLGQLKGMKIGHLSLKNLKEMTSREIWKADNNRDFESRYQRKEEIYDQDDVVVESGPLASKTGVEKTSSWNFTLGVRTELQFAKKDKDLLDYFRQNCIEAKFPLEVVTARDAAEVLDRWMAKIIENNTTGDTITKKQVLDIFSVLGVKDDDLLDFIKVAKVGAVLASMHKNASKVDQPFLEHGVFASKNRLSKKFCHMKTSSTLVTYNSMGEKVVQKRDFSKQSVDGIPKGYAETIRKLWKKEPPRVPYHVNKATMISPLQTGVMMREVPYHIAPLLYRRTKLPKVWSPELTHYFDVRRTVRVSRTLFDMRQSAQQSYLLRVRDANGPVDRAPSLTSLMMTYFERNYGAGEGWNIPVAHTKVVHYLEALCQYSEYALLNCMRFFLFSEENQSDPMISIQKYEWLYVEARKWLFNHCSIINGGDVTALQSTSLSIPSSELHHAGQYLEPSIGTVASSTGGSGPKLHWVLIKRSDAMMCADEMLRQRGCYGPAVVDNILSVLDSVLSPASPNMDFDYDSDIPVSEDYVDLEQFLEALTFETRKHDQDLVDTKDVIFGASAAPRTTIRSSIGSRPRKVQSGSLEVPPSSSGDAISSGKVVIRRTDSSVSTMVSTLSALQDLFQLYMAYDPSRSGFIGSDAFRACTIQALHTSMTDDDVEADVYYREQDNKEILVRQCIMRFSTGEGSDSIGYIDFVALCLSYLIQQVDRVHRLHSSWMLNALSSIRRGIDRDQGKALLHFLAKAQAYPASKDLFWMSRQRSIDAPASSMYSTETSYYNGLMRVRYMPPPLLPPTVPGFFGERIPAGGGISYAGEWSVMGSLPASNDPGLLTIKKIIPSASTTAAEVSLGVDGTAWKTQVKTSVDSNLYIEPKVSDTNRTMSTLHGEVYREHYCPRQSKSPAPISSADLTDTVLEEGTTDHTDVNNLTSSSRFAPSGSQIIDGVRLDNDALDLSLFEYSLDSGIPWKPVSLRIPSHDFANIDSDVSLNSLTTNVESIDSKSARRECLEEIQEYKKNKKNRVEEDKRLMQERTHTAIMEARRKRDLKMEGSGLLHHDTTVSLGSGNVSDVVNLHCKIADVYPPGFEEKVVAESLDEFDNMRKMEEEMMRELEELGLKNSLRMHQKYMEQRALKREMRAKELESLRLKEEADEERYRRNQAARELQEQARLKAEADRVAAEEESRKRQNEIREARAAQERAKKEKEEKDAELHRELLELQAMRREEKVSISYEQAVREQLAREEKIRLEKEAKEEAAREAERLKLIKEEEEKLAREAAEKAKREKEALMLERQRETQEGFEMVRHDINVNRQIHPANSMESENDIIERMKSDHAPSVQGEDEEIAIENNISKDEQECEIEENEAKKRLKALISNLEATKNGQKHHPRKKDRKYFMPLAFGDDFSFDPFSLPVVKGGPPNLRDDSDEDTPESGFKDITRTIRERKVQLEKKRLTQLYQLNNPDVPPSEWTPMFRLDPIDWVDFFEDEYQYIMEEFGIRQSTPDMTAEVLRGLKRAKDSAGFGSKTGQVISTRSMDGATYILGNSTGQVAREALKKELVPLPFGRVLKRSLGCGCDHYFQIELADLTSILTIELSCKEGGNEIDMDLSCTGYFPSPVKHDIKSSKYHAQNRQIIAFQPYSTNNEEDFLRAAEVDPCDTKTFILGVHHKPNSSIEMIPYTLWAMASAKPRDSEHIANVSKSITFFEALIEHDSDDLWKNLPKYQRIAQEKADAIERRENSLNRHGIDLSSLNTTVSPPPKPSTSSPKTRTSRRSSTMSRRRASTQSSSGLTSPLESTRSMCPSDFSDRPPLETEQEKDIKSFETFIAKSGRMKMKKDIDMMKKTGSLSHSIESGKSRLASPVNPNMHADLFVPSTIEDIAGVASIDNLDENEASDKNQSCDAREIQDEGELGSISVLSDVKYVARSPRHNPDNDMSEQRAMQQSESLPVLMQSSVLRSTKSRGEAHASSLGDLTASNHIQFPFLGKTAIGNKPMKSKSTKKPRFLDPKPIVYTTRK